MPATLGIVASQRTAAAGPAIPTTGLTAWFDADDASTFTYGTAPAVAEWRSKSPATAVGGQTIVGYRPPRNGTLNGKTTVTFNIHALRGNPWPNAYGVESLFMVIVPRNAASQRMVLGCARTPGTAPPRRVTIETSLKLRVHAASDVIDTTATVTLDSAVLFTSLRNIPTHGVSGPVKLYLNRTLTTDTTSVYGGSADGIQDMGADYHDYPDYGGGNFIGDIAELVQYNRYVTDLERQQVENYLRTKWGTP